MLRPHGELVGSKVVDTPAPIVDVALPAATVALDVAGAWEVGFAPDASMVVELVAVVRELLAQPPASNVTHSIASHARPLWA